MYLLPGCVCLEHRLLQELYVSHCQNQCVYKSGQAWPNAWKVFGRKPSRVGHGRRDAVVWVLLCFWCGVVVFFIVLFSAANAQGIRHANSYMFQLLGCRMITFVGSLDVWVYEALHVGWMQLTVYFL